MLTPALHGKRTLSPCKDAVSDELQEKTRLYVIKVLNASRLLSNFQINYCIFS